LTVIVAATRVGVARLNYHRPMDKIGSMLFYHQASFDEPTFPGSRLPPMLHAPPRIRLAPVWTRHVAKAVQLRVVARLLCPIEQRYIV
jgi:hypothetical protein